MSYKTLIINDKSNLSYKENYIIIDKGDKYKEFICNISCIIINSLQITITFCLLNELNKNNIPVIFCDNKSNPAFQTLPIYGCHNASLVLKKQILWKDERKSNIWTKIVKNKIINQQKLIERKFRLKDVFIEYIENIQINDKGNFEAFVARKYFYMLFGTSFNRNKESNINSALNYGYTILLSLINKVVVSKGYTTMLGIKHSCATNQFNLSSDIIEPFRPIVDNIVFDNQEKKFDYEYKKKLINCMNQTITYKQKSYKLTVAIELYLNDITNYLNNNVFEIGEISIDY